MKIKIIPEKCIACGLCHLYAPEVFDYDDAGIVRFYRDKEGNEDIEDKSAQLAQDFNKNLDNLSKAVKNCPTRALQSEQNKK